METLDTAPPTFTLNRSTIITTKKMATTTPNKHELRTRETRELLLQAAERIFVRDGYEKAELGEIAAVAGRTKGSIYAQFKSKEEVFLALVETHALRRRAKMQQLLAASTTIEGNLAAMRRQVLEFSADDTWGLLLLEFRLYAVRHPDSRERLRQTYAAITAADEEARYTEILGPAPKEKGAVPRKTAVHAMFATLSALQLESRFDLEAVPQSEIANAAAKIFDALFLPSKPEK